MLFYVIIKKNENNETMYLTEENTWVLDIDLAKRFVENPWKICKEFGDNVGFAKVFPKGED